MTLPRGTVNALLIIATVALAGCGFHLRGETGAIPPQFASLYLEGVGPYSALGEELRHALRGAGGTIVDRRQDAQAVLRILRQEFEQRVLSVGPTTGKAREFGLRLVVEFDVVSPQGALLVPRQQLVLLQEYTFEINQVLGKADDAALLRENMLRDAAQQVMWRLSARTS